VINGDHCWNVADLWSGNNIAAARLAGLEDDLKLVGDQYQVRQALLSVFSSC
jgi:hypothetical protein